MRSVVLLSLAIALIATGCAKPPQELYSHPKTGKTQLTAHIDECGQLADKFGFINMSPVHQYPMPDMKDGSQRERVFRFCMMKKGYERGTAGAIAVDWTDVKIRVADTTLAPGDSSLVTISFGSPVGGFENSDLSVENGRLTSVTSIDNGLTWTAVLTPTPGVDDPDNVIRLDNSGVIDRVSNIGTGFTISNNYAVNSQHQLVTASVGPAGGAIR